MRTSRVGGLAATALAVIATGAPGLFAQMTEGPAVALSLADATARSLETSHRLGELAARREGNDAFVQSVRAGGLPQLAVLGGYTRTNHVDEFGIPQPNGSVRLLYPDVPDNWRSRVDLQWPLYTGGRIQALTEAARAEALASARDVDAARTDLRFEVARAYWGLVTAREGVKVVEGALRRVEAYLADAKARFDAGFVASNDVFAAEAQRSLQQALLIEARNLVGVSTLALARLAGLPPGTIIEPTESLDLAPSPGAEAAQLVEEARRRRDDRAAIEARRAAAAARVDAAGAGFKPVVSVLGGADMARPNPKIFPRADEWQGSWDLGISAAWSVFDGGRTRADVATAAAAARAWHERLQDYDTQLDAEIRQRLLEAGSSRARVTAARDAVRSAAEARRVLEERYRAGVATSTEVLDAQVVLLEAELGAARALAALRLADAGLERAVGR
jgi:outer membrane protein TolC